MGSPHLDRDKYCRLKSGEIDPDEAQQISEHLASHCDICDAFLASLPPDSFDGETDAFLTSIAANRLLYAGNDLEFARIERALGRSSPALRARTWMKLTATTVLALVMVAVASFLLLHSPNIARSSSENWDGIKGINAPVAVHLRLAIVEVGGHPTRVVRKESGAVFSPNDRLAFRVEVERPAYVALVRVGSGDSELIWKQRILHSGMVDVTWEDGRTAVYPLHGLVGDQQFVLIAGERLLSEAELNAATVSLVQRGRLPLGIGGDVIRVKVR